jgi:hypothetical protein
MRRALSLVFGLALCGCGQGMAPKNPLLPSVSAVTPAACPARINFEAAGSDALWQAPSWAAGNVGGWPMRVSNQAACGQWSLETQMNVTNVLGTYTGANAILYTVLPQEQDFDGKTLSVYVYFSKSANGIPSAAPPADLGVTLQLEDLGQNWVPTSGNQPFLALKPGWNLLQRYFYGAQVQDIMALNIQVSTANGVSYAGYMWIDEISW